MVSRETRTDDYFMNLAVEQAKAAMSVSEVPVGCVFVHNNKVIASGFNETNASLNGTRHSEFVAVDKILKEYRREIFHETILYVTVEPCIMCASALKILGIKKVVFGCENYRFGGNGSVLSVHNGYELCRRYSNVFREGRYEVIGGVMKETAIELLQTFYEAGNPCAPVPHRNKKASPARTGSLLSTCLWYIGWLRRYFLSFSQSIRIVFGMCLKFLSSKSVI
ncbi:tRNA-specific adenosine deaminase 2 [Neolecta irregularis DAH-3]|uniref:tRNA-specific adenosine deaminase 2 n=1 Tax=Neolecta irregularis (strain DAH-3) TaxID=1198029 RepID=A0A1U7LN46_NEOID|nr:tRNA-specific adenosine deaminase 2 [Neolecta irregularis DAH-3]|eukprot:OLL24048.1 tRNA-specific adenosine deaminase 2 [Neolecta irregularis DAH-3]